MTFEKQVRQLRNHAKKFNNEHLPEFLKLMATVKPEQLTEIAIGDIREINDYLMLIYGGIRKSIKDREKHTDLKPKTGGIE